MVLKNTWVDGETVYAKDQNDIANAVNALDSGGTGPAGPAGPAGADGATGPAGPKGDTGATGPKGDPGDPGVAGSAGATGPAGPAGTDGATGPAGPEGPQGIAGSDGTVGPAGPQGEPGAQGETGLQGIQGEQGIPGLGITFKGALPTEEDLPDGALQGDLYIVEDPAPAHGWVWDETEGAYVDAGPVQGPQGIEGPQGIQGEAGPAGSDGAAGPKGDTGPAGPKGDPGDPGTVTGFLPLAGGDMTGTITLPSGSVGLAVKNTNYNLLGGSGGVAFRNGTANIVNFTGGEIVNYVPLTTPATGVGVKFGSGGPSLSKSGTSIASSAPITVAAAPTAATELANKAYVDSKAGGGGVSADDLNLISEGSDGGAYVTGASLVSDGTGIGPNALWADSEGKLWSPAVSAKESNRLLLWNWEGPDFMGFYVGDWIAYTSSFGLAGSGSEAPEAEDIIPLTRPSVPVPTSVEAAQKGEGRGSSHGQTVGMTWEQLLGFLRTDLPVSGGGVANPVAGSVEGLTLWLGSQAAYDALTPDAKTIYYIV